MLLHSVLNLEEESALIKTELSGQELLLVKEAEHLMQI